MDRLLCRFGLPGYAFVPLLSSHACAIPGILSTRLIPDRHDRFATILVAPFMSCSARLPVYVLLTNFLFADRPLLAGVAFAGLLSARRDRRARRAPSSCGARSCPARSRPMVLELPTYKRPSLRVAFAQRVRAGLVVPAHGRHGDPGDLFRHVVALGLSEGRRRRRRPSALSARPRRSRRSTPSAPRGLTPRRRALTLRRTSRRRASPARLGRFVEPVFAPLGYDWRLTMGVLTELRGARGLRLDPRRAGRRPGRGRGWASWRGSTARDATTARRS